jgi:hypothetical protein
MNFSLTVFIKILPVWMFFLTLTGTAQTNVSTLLQSKTWVFCWSINSLIAKEKYDSLTFEKQEACRFQFEFLADGELKYTDLLVNYDPSKGCSNSFRDFTGSWNTLNQKVYIKLEYNTFANQPAFILNYEVRYESPTELILISEK